jgi:hypothetical protein
MKDNAYSFAWSEDGILREIIAVYMKGIDFYRRLCSSIHPNYLPSPPLFFLSVYSLHYKGEIIGLLTFFFYSCDCKITPCVWIMKL